MASKPFNHFSLTCFFLTIFISSTFAQTCKNYTFPANQNFTTCTDLPYLSSFLHYSYYPASATLQIAYRHTDLGPSRWVAWAINPTSTFMLGSQAFVAYLESNQLLRVYKSSLTSYETTLPESDLSFPVSNYSATFVNNEMTIFATFAVPNNLTILNQLWQEGPVTRDAPRGHDISAGVPNRKTMATLDLLSGQTTLNTGGAGGNSRQRRRNIHGVLNAISWGIMMPFGAIIARYVKVFPSADPAWFYMHIVCQTSAYILGVSGWALGLKLGSESPGIVYTRHRSIGITLFCLGTLQVLALLLRPNKEHKLRKYWNYYHHGIGYLVIFLSVVNIYKGFNILEPKKSWKTTYTALITILAISAVFLEAFTCWIKRKKSHRAVTMQQFQPNL